MRRYLCRAQPVFTDFIGKINIKFRFSERMKGYFVLEREKFYPNRDLAYLPLFSVVVKIVEDVAMDGAADVGHGARVLAILQQGDERLDEGSADQYLIPALRVVKILVVDVPKGSVAESLQVGDLCQLLNHLPATDRVVDVP